MKKIFQYTRRAAQRRLYAFEMSSRQHAATLQSELDLGEPAFDRSPNPTLVEGHVLRRKITDTEYDGHVG